MNAEEKKQVEELMELVESKAAVMRKEQKKEEQKRISSNAANWSTEGWNTTNSNTATNNITPTNFNEQHLVSCNKYAYINNYACNSQPEPVPSYNNIYTSNRQTKKDSYYGAQTSNNGIYDNDCYNNTSLNVSTAAGNNAGNYNFADYAGGGDYNFSTSSSSSSKQQELHNANPFSSSSSSTAAKNELSSSSSYSAAKFKETNVSETKANENTARASNNSEPKKSKSEPSKASELNNSELNPTEILLRKKWQIAFKKFDQTCLVDILDELTSSYKKGLVSKAVKKALAKEWNQDFVQKLKASGGGAIEEEKVVEGNLMCKP